jgi:formylglycine-generating enzyme required for sulfatase activity
VNATTRFLLIFSTTWVLLCAGTFASKAQTIQNPSFETPNVGPVNGYTSYSFNPSGAVWTFSGNAGIAANGSGYVYFSPPNPVPNGTQCAFLQSISDSDASISQTINCPAANDFTFTFYSSQRDIDTRDNNANQTITVRVDGTTVFSAVPPVGWQEYNTAPIFLTAGNHTLTFSCAEVPGNATVLVDEVGLVPAFTYVTNENNTITITGYVNPGGNLTIPDTISGFPVTTIAVEAFAGDTLNSVTIGTNVTSIGPAAFAACTSLTSISVNAGNPAYSSLNGVLFDQAQDTLIQYPAGLANSAYTVPNSVVTIGENAFYDCSSLTSVTIPNSVIYIGDQAFFGCSSLASINIPNSVTYIEEGAFEDCTSLTSVTIPNSITGIGQSAFYDCASLSNVVIPNSVTSIGSSAFADCSSLTSIYFEGNAPFADPDAFAGSPVTAYYLPGTTGWAAFASETGLTPQLWPVGVQISATPTNAPVGSAVQFSCPGVDLNGNTITNWAWNFGDGATSTNQNPTHVYATAGSYAPVLITGNNAGTSDAGYGLAISAFPRPTLSSISLSGANLTINGSNSRSGLTYYVLATTNLLLPISQWMPIATNVWSTSGNFSLTVTNAVNPSIPQRFFLFAATNPTSTPAGMALIPAGSFTIGDTLDGESDAIPTNVYVSAFYMDTNLVDDSQWEAVYNWATANGYSFDDAGTANAANQPVYNLDWYDVVKWCNARSQQAGLTPVYYTDAGMTQVYTNGDTDSVYPNWTVNGYRLPTEAEWEKAARGGLAGQRFPWGDTISESQANYQADPGDYTYDLGPYYGYNTNFDTGDGPYTSPIGFFAPNGYGLYDMAGNVTEWCWDWYSAPPYPAGSPYLGGSDPRGPANSGNRVMRGGSWYDYANYLSCSHRNYTQPYSAYFTNLGFRCVTGF